MRTDTIKSTQIRPHRTTKVLLSTARFGKEVRTFLAALILCLSLPATALAATTTIFSANFNNGTSGAVTGISSLGTPAAGSWSFNGAFHGGVSSDTDKAAAFVHNLSAVANMTLMPANGVVVGTTYPVTITADAGGSSGKALIANLAQPGSFTGGASTTISFKWGQFGLANSGAFKYGFVRGLDASGNEVFELLFTHINPVTSAQIYRRGAGDSQTTVTSATVGTPQGTVLITAFPDTTHSGATVATKPTGLVGVTITLANGQVTYAFSKGTASANPLTYTVNSSATTISKLEFSETWNSTLGDVVSNSKGYWLDDVSVTTTTYTLTYNGNGNDGGTAPTDGSSPYVAGSTVTVLGNTGSLTKSGNSFKGWNTAANGSGTAYVAGNTFNIAANTTLYAQWNATVTYDGNGSDGGTVPVDGSSPYVAGSTVTVLGNTGSLTKSGNSFNGWNTAANGSGTAYSAGNTFSIAADTTLYAQWLGSATITAPATFPDAVSTTYGTNSSPQSVSVSGSGLTVNITATAPTGLEVSSDGSTFGATATFTQSGGNASGTLSVRLKNNTLVSGSYDSKNIVLSSSGASPVNVATTASGNTVTAKALTIASATAQDKLRDGNISATVTGTLQSTEAFGSGNSGDGKPYTGDSLTVTCTGSTFASSAVGTQSVTAGTFGVTGSAAGNYTVTQPSLSLSASILGTGVWTNTVASATWGTAANWTNNIIATNTDNTADFNQVDIPADTTVNLTTPLTIGKLIFGDTETSTTPAGWTLANNSTPANILTLADTMPTITINALGTDKSATISAVIAGTSGLTKAGTGMLRLSGANTYTGGTTIANGTLQLGSANTLGDGNVTVQSGATLDLNNLSLTNKADYVVHIAGMGVTNGGALVNNNATQLNNSVTNLVLDADASIGGVGRFDLRLLGIVAPEVNLGTHTLTKVRGNIVFFQQIAPITNGNIVVESGALGLTEVVITNVSSTITVSNGSELRLFRSGSFNPSIVTSPMVFEAPALLSYTGNNVADAIDQSIGSAITLTGTVSNNVTIAGAVLELAGVISGSGGINKGGAGTLLLSGASTYSGNTTISAGTLTIGGAGHLGSGSYAANITNNAAFNYASFASQTLSGEISGSGSLTNSGSGTLTLSGNNTYTGPTTVNAGTLLVNGSLASGSTVTIASSATLGGNGTISGAVTVNSGGTLSPGASIGTLTLGAPPVLGGTLAMGINPTDLSSDKLNLPSGVFTYGGTLALTVTAGTLAGGEVFDLFDFAGTSSGSFMITTTPTLAANLNWWTGLLASEGKLVLNRAPTAQALSLGARSGTPVSLEIIGGKRPPSDADGNPMMVTAVSSPTANGATVTTDGIKVTYTALSTYTGPDSFTYAVSDNRGGSSAAATVSVDVASGSGASPNVVAGPTYDPSSGKFSVTFAGIPNYEYTVEYAEGSAAPPWSKLKNVTAGTNGLFVVEDTASQSPSRFYRTVYPSY